jgi:DNA-binding GntR family transcriptional regulator
MNAREKPGELMGERAYIGARDLILGLELAPGSPIDEEALMAKLEVGRTPVREAIKRLALEDLVVVYPRRGTFVADINITDLGHITEVRRLLESYAAYKAAQASPADRQEAQVLLDDMEAIAKEPVDTARLMEFDRRVHRFMWEKSGNPFLASTVGNFYNLSVRIWYLVLNRLPTLGDTVFEHRELLDAIRDGEADRAREVAEAHVSNFADTVRGALLR